MLDSVSSALSRLADVLMGEDRLTVLAYHRIAWPHADQPGAPWLISATPRGFARQLDYVKSRHTPIDLDQLVGFVVSGRPLPPRPLLITFDDGYRDNYEIAMPLLEEREMPAVFFISSGFVGTSRAAWWDRLWHALRTTRLAEATFPTIGRVRLDRSSARRYLLSQLDANLKRHSIKERLLLLDLIEDELRVQPLGTDHRMFMSWAEAREICHRGFDVQAHTVDHPILAAETPFEARRQIKDSIAAVSECTGCAPRAFAIPNGRPEDYRPSEFDALRDAGISVCFTMLSGSVRSEDARRRPLEIPRVAVALKDGPGRFRAKLARPARVGGRLIGTPHSAPRGVRA